MPDFLYEFCRLNSGTQAYIIRTILTELPTHLILNCAMLSIDHGCNPGTNLVLTCVWIAVLSYDRYLKKQLQREELCFDSWPAVFNL